VLLTTTVYNLGWIKAVLYDKWRRGDPEIKVVHFDSIENPQFPRAEWESAKASLPDWKFQMFYRGRYTKPAGAIYDCYDEERHEVEPRTDPRRLEALHRAGLRRRQHGRHVLRRGARVPRS
jgi:hypothetical protein